MIKNYNQYINEDLLSKKITFKIPCDNLAQLYPSIKIKYNTDYKIVISNKKGLMLNESFYTTLASDEINKDDIIFENCEEIRLYDVNGFVSISEYGTFRSGIKVFYCSDCSNLTSLKGAPEIVSDSFYCSDCVNLTNLEGAPEIVGGNFSCHCCTNLINIDSAPDKVGGNFHCTGCNPNFINLAKEKYGFKVIA